MTAANIVATLQGELRQRLVDLRGTPAFAEALAQREQAMGVSAAAATAAEDAGNDGDDGNTRAVLENPMPPLTPLPPQRGHLDSWGNTILDVPGQYVRFGQYRVRSAWDGRILRVCGEAASRTHLPFWRYDPGERRMVCGVCWPGKLSERQSEQRATSMDMTASVTPRPETSSETSSKSEGTSHV